MMKAAIRAYAFGSIPKRKTVNGDRSKVKRMMTQLVEGDRTLNYPYPRSRFAPNPAALALQDQFAGYMMRLPSSEHAEGRNMFYTALHQAMGEALDDMEDEAQDAASFGPDGLPYNAGMWPQSFAGWPKQSSWDRSRVLASASSPRRPQKLAAAPQSSATYLN